MPAVPDTIVSDIRAASRHLVRGLGFLDKTIAGTDLSASSVHAILEIGLTPGLTARELGERLKLEKSTVSRMLKGLDKRGALVLKAVESDGRSQALHLTEEGERLFSEIDAFGDAQARRALNAMQGTSPEAVAEVLTAYSEALMPKEADQSFTTNDTIVEGYQTGMIGDIAALHARTHGPVIGMGPAFESVVSAAMAEFMTRIENPTNNSWSVLDGSTVIGSISIDGEDLKGNIAHLRWFILSEKLRGRGLGRTLLQKALNHCDHHGFNEIHLWTLKGLDAARTLYEKSGFELADEYVGDQWGKAVTEQKFVRKRP